MRRTHLPVDVDGHQIDDPFDDLNDELHLADTGANDEARREAQIAQALAILT